MARSWILAVSPWLLAPMHGCGLVDLLAQTAPSTLEPAGAEPDPAPRPSPVDVSPDAAAVGPQASTAAGLPGAAVPDAPEPALVVVVNGQPLDAGALASLRRRDIDVEPGRYWYDGRCGAWGREGEGVAGFLPAGLVVGGTLSPDASGGDTEVFINRRELTAIEVAALARLGTVVPGRYWLDGNGNWGLEAGPMVGNLRVAAQAAGATGQTRRSAITGIGMGGSGGSGYVMGKDWSVSW